MRAPDAAKWHPTPQEQAVCDQIEGGCPHDAEFIASLPWPDEQRRPVETTRKVTA